MPDAIITATSSTFGTITGTFAADQSAITGTISGLVDGTLTGSVGIPGPQGPAGSQGPQGQQGDPGPAGVGVPVGGTTGQFLTKNSGTNYDTSWSTLSLSGYATESWVTSQNYITSAALTPYLLSSTAASTYYPLTGNPSGFLTSSALTGYATQSWVTSQGYITSSALTGYATQAWVDSQGYLQAGALSGYLLSSTAASTYAVIAAGQPTSGTVGQVLTKNSGTNYDSSWQTLIPGDRYLTTSTTSLSVSNGTKTLTVGTGLSYSPQQDVVISYDGTAHMHAVVTSYNSGTGAMVVDVQNHTGSGTYALWTVNVGGTVPLQSIYWGEILGVLGDQGDLASALNSKLETSTAASTYYLQTNPAGYITSSALSGYATESWVSAIGYITDAPSDGSQYARKDGAWDVVTPATNYITSVSSPLYVTSGNLAVDLSGYATETWVGTQGFLDTSGVLALLAPYAEINNPVFTGDPRAPTPATSDNDTSIATTAFVKAQGYLTSAPVTSVAGRTGAITLAVADVSGAAPLASPSLTGTPLSTTAAVDTNTTQIATTAYVVGQGYLKSATASSTYAPLASPALTGTPTSTTAAVNTNTTQIATTAFVLGQGNSTAGTIAMNGTQAAGTSNLYARADHVHPTDTSRAPLASPTFTGTPSLPTGTIAVTQSAGNNTTAVATTAFVTAAVPSFSTVAQSRSASSTTVTQNPNTSLWQSMYAGTIDIARSNLTYTATGTMGSSGSGFLVSRMTLGTVGACGGSYRVFGGSQIDQAYGLWSKSYRSYIDFSKRIWCSGRIYTEDNINDPNVTVAFYCGKAQNSANGNLARAGFGWKFSGNATAGNRLFVVCAHNGTTLSTVTSSFAIVAQQYADWDLVSDGAGNVTLYINGTQVATTTGGPTADTSYSGTAPVIWNEEIVTTGTSAGFNATFGRGRISMAP